MKNKKFIFIFITISIGIQVCIYTLYYLINPEQFFQNSLTEKKYFYTKEFSKKQFNILKKQSSILIFGTSQIHMISSELMGQKILNFHNLYGESGDIKNFLFQLDNKQIKNIKNIIFLIDLRAGAARQDINLLNYNENSIMPSLSLLSVKRIYYDIRNNYNKINTYLNQDGSITKGNSKSHIKEIKSFNGKSILNYNNKLINNILEINTFAKKNNISIRYITPVCNDKYFKTIDLNHLYPFFKVLLEKGIDKIGLFYFIEGISNIKNEKGEYISFLEKDHLNIIYLKIWLDKYILKENKLYIHNEDELKRYIETMKKKQSLL